MDPSAANLATNQSEHGHSISTAQANIISTYVLEVDWSQIKPLDGQTAVLEFHLDNVGHDEVSRNGDSTPIIVEFHLNEVVPSSASTGTTTATTIPSNYTNPGLIPKPTDEETSAILNFKQTKPKKCRRRAAKEPKIESKTKDKNTETEKQGNKPKSKCNRKQKQKLTQDELETRQGHAVNGKPASRQPVPCPQCSKVFSSAHSLKRHAVAHSDDPSPFKCGDCGKCFTQGAALLVHKREMHAERNVSYPCAFCPKKFRRRRVLKSHILKAHSPDVPPPSRPNANAKTGDFECLKCNAKFRYRQDLTRHEGSHTGEKPHNCPLCPRSFRLAYNLREHIGGHLGERKFQSKYCQRSFRQKYLLQRHERRHEEEGICKSRPSRPARCQECSAMFPNRFLFNQHVLLQHQARNAQVTAAALSSQSSDLIKCL